MYMHDPVQGLLDNEEVHGIVGLLNPTEATIATQLGDKYHIPVFAFSPSSFQSPYFIQVSLDDSYRPRAIASIFQYFNWTNAVVIYQENDSGDNFVSKLNQQFNEVGVQTYHMIPIPSSVEDSYIVKQLNKTMELPCTIFVVHVSSISIASRIFLLARNLKMMNVGYGWIVTDSLSNLMDSMSSSDINYMEGGLGIRPNIPDSEALDNFKAKWKMDKKSNAYGLWAYDIIWALSKALENVGEITPSFSMSKENISVSNVGPKLLKELLRTKFTGLSGKFDIFEGKLQRSGVEIMNVLGSGGRTVGYWSDDRGSVEKMESDEGNPTYSSTSVSPLKRIIFPGDTFTKPIGWMAKKGRFRVGVPEKKGFTEFVGVDGKNVTGISIRIFHCVLNRLRDDGFQLDYDFHSFKIEKQGSASYNDMLKNVPKDFDIVVGDATILAARASFVEFALPYSDSGVVMVVKNERRVNMWIFTQPLRWDLWLTVVAACIFIGLTLRYLEHRSHEDNMRSESERQHDSLGLHLFFPITALAFPERNMVANNWSRFVLVVWLCMAFVLMQSYTAKLSSIFTVDQLRFDQNYNVGYQAGSFVKDLMISTLRFPESKLKPYSSIEEYHEAMTSGSKNGGVDAIFDELPYVKVFLRKYGNKYKMIGQTYKTEGFGFAFPIGSPLVHHFSKAILEVTQNRSLCDIEINDGVAVGYPYVNDDSSSISQDNPSLTASDFGGLFIIVGSATLLAVFCSECPLGKALCRNLTEYSNRCLSFSPGRVHSIERKEEPKEDAPPPSLDHQQVTGEVQLSAVVGDHHSLEETDQTRGN
ncbi:transmembrane signal receptor [Lithospermum erythrorhizon]|uniref:Glutamate receptor n=1 Tax=Lithospermum erythrorhizon TaxID=34254 RepID=A0AAV3NN58_LITER